MRWRFEQREEKQKRLEKERGVWSPKFAYFPTKIHSSNEWIWIEPFEQKMEYVHGYDASWWRRLNREIGSDWELD